jgi:hypothetical protein
MATYKSGCRNFKSLIDDSYAKVDSFFPIQNKLSTFQILRNGVRQKSGW